MDLIACDWIYEIYSKSFEIWNEYNYQHVSQSNLDSFQI